MMEPVLAEILDGGTYVRAPVVVIVPQEITGHADFARPRVLSLGSSRPVAEKTPRAIESSHYRGKWRVLSVE